MTTELTNKEKYQQIDEILDELEYMRRVAFNNAVLSPEDIRYKSVSIYGIMVENQATIKGLKQRYATVMASGDKTLPDSIYNKIKKLYNQSKTKQAELVLEASDRREIKELISKAEEIRNTKVKERGIVTISDTSEIIQILKEYSNTDVLTPYQKETLDIYTQAIENKYKELKLEN